MPLTGRSGIPSHSSRTRVLHGAAKTAGLVLTLICLLVTSLVESQEAVTNSRNVPALRSAINTEPAAASALLTFKQASRTFRNFKVESPAEFVKMQSHYQKLLSQGRLTHKFRTATGQLVHCIEIGSQDSVKRAGIDPRNIPTGPAAPPGGDKDATMANVANAALA